MVSIILMMFSFNYWSMSFSCVNISNRPARLNHLSKRNIFRLFYFIFYGDHPLAVVTDVNKKIVFRCSYLQASQPIQYTHKKSFSYCAPFMNPGLKGSPFLLNSSLKKIYSNGSMEEDLRELLEKRILEMLSHDTFKKGSKYC